MSEVVQSSALSKATYTVYTIYIAILFTISFPVHLLSFKFLIKHILHRHKARELSPYLLNICIANFVSLILQFPIVFIASMQKGWSTLGPAACYISGITCGTCSTVVIITLTLMSVKLYRTIEKDLGSHELNPNRRRTNPIKFGATWIISLLMFIPTTFGWNSMVSDGPHCSPNWQADSIPNASYLVVIAISSFIVPLVVFILYFVKMTRYLMRHHNHESYTLHQMRLRVLHIDARNLIGGLTLVYMLLWLPYWFYGFSTLFGRHTEKNGDLAIIPWLCISLSVIYFPFMYVAINKRFRLTLMSLLGCKKFQVNPSIAVEKTETFEVLSNSNATLPRAGSPSILVPRSPLVNRAFRLSVFEDEELRQQKHYNNQLQDLYNPAVSRLIRCSLHAAAHEPRDEGQYYGQTSRRNTTVT